MGFLRCFYDILWFHGVSEGVPMAFLWDSYGGSKGCLWDLDSYGISMIFL